MGTRTVPQNLTDGHMDGRGCRYDGVKLYALFQFVTGHKTTIRISSTTVLLICLADLTVNDTADRQRRP